MTTFDDDSARLNFGIGPIMAPLSKIGLEWPPPERIYVDEGAQVREAREGDEESFIMERVSMSEITDEQRAGMTHVFRGAEYVYLADLPPVTDLTS